MKTTKVRKLRGYQAAGVIITKLTDSAEKDRPTGRVNRNSKAFCAGYFHGLAAADAIMVLGEFPNVPENAKLIQKNIP